MTMIEEANQRMMDRYREMTCIEVVDGGVWVTLDGEHYLNDPEKLDEALKRVAAARPS